MNNTLIDNTENFIMRDVLRNFIVSGKYNHICIATGYWDLPGMQLIYSELKTFLEAGGRLDILIGQEPQLRTYQTRALEEDEERFPDFYLQRDINLLTDEFRPTAELIQQFCKVKKYDHIAPEGMNRNDSEDVEEQDDSQIQIRIYGQKENEPKQFLHAKCYIFLGQGEADGIIGSSNFTKKGLEDNAELNYIETQNSIVTAPMDEYSNSKSHKVWFDEKWEESKPWNGKFLQILSSAPIGKPTKEPEHSEDIHENDSVPLTPYELYIKLLQTKFGDLVDKNLNEIIESYLPKEYDRYDYQIDAVKQCISTMKEHGGFLLADVVGLGKTIVGALIIKHFIQFPDEDGRERKVLIITPPAIQSAWKDTITDFDRNVSDKIEYYVDYITTGSIRKLVGEDAIEDDDEKDTGSFSEDLKQENYGLIIIDESHKFRNSGTAMYKALDELISDIGNKTGVYPYVGLLSATPQNNRPNDLKNQIYLFERNYNDSSLKKADGGNLESFFSKINEEYHDIIYDEDNSENTEERNNQIKELFKRIRDNVLTDIMVRRTRTDVKKYYMEDMERQGLQFPEIIGPISLNYKMDKQLAMLFAETMDYIAPTTIYKLNNDKYLSYYRYRSIQYLVDDNIKRKYNARGSRDADTLAEQLAKIMQINLVKRLESSFSAFYQSLLNLRQYTLNMINMWESGCIFICPQIDVNAELDYKTKEEKRHKKVSFEDCLNDIRAKIKELDDSGRNEDGRNHEYTCNDMKSEYITLLKHDYNILCELCDRWAKNSEDPKLDVFKENLNTVLFNKETNIPQKLVIFSEAIDTVKTIKRVSENKGFRVLEVTASNRHVMEQTIRENFDANYGNNPGEIQKNDYDIIVTTEVLAEGINLHRANVILNYDTPWNSTRLMQRIGRVNRIGSSQNYVYVYNFKPSAEGDAEIRLVKKAYTKLQSFHILFGEDSRVYTENEKISHYDLNTTVNGEESPLEKYVFELKKFKEKNPERYEFIQQLNDGLELSINNASGKGLFLVNIPKRPGFFVSVDPNEDEGEIISLFDMIEQIRPNENSIITDLPLNWNDLRNEAERVVTAELASVRIRQSNRKCATDAKAAIIELKQNQQMSKESRALLNSADRLIRQGNNDIIKRILKIGKAVKEKNILFPYTQEEFDKYLSSEIEKIVSNVHMHDGNPKVFIGMYK